MDTVPHNVPHGVSHDVPHEDLTEKIYATQLSTRLISLVDFCYLSSYLGRN